MKENKFDIQDEEYIFPYHYLTSLNNQIPNIEKRLSWGLEYLTYNNFIIKYIEEIIKPKSLLDIGCGDGYLINNLNYSSNNNFLGIDLSSRAIKFANAFSNGYEFKVEDLFKVNQTFQVVSLIEVIEHIPDDMIEKFIDEAKSKVERGGYLIISVPTTVDPVQPKHYRHYDEELVEKHINPQGFELVEQKRLFKKSKFLDKISKKIFKQRSNTLKRILWSLHKKNSYFASREKGKHIVCIYQKNN